MDIREQRLDDIILIGPCGRLDSLTYREFETHLLGVLNRLDKPLVIDFSRLDYISSAGLRVLLMAAKRIRATQGKMALAALSSSIREVFDISGFSAIFEIHPSFK